MKRRLVVSVAILVLLAFAAPLTWSLLGCPPPWLVLKYGISPYCEPTGREMTVEGIEFVEIGPGRFRMGSHYFCEEGDLLGRMSAIFGLDWGVPSKHDSDGCPPHWVEFEGPFWIANCELTAAAYRRFDPDHSQWREAYGPDAPVIQVSGERAAAYCRWLEQRTGLTVRLPTEAEWECSCLAGNAADWGTSGNALRFADVAWYAENGGGRPHGVREKKPNAWGLYDMHGNVREWCQDYWTRSYLHRPPVFQRVGPLRVIRGGGFGSTRIECRARGRDRAPEASQDVDIGFRLALSLAGSQEHLLQPYLVDHE